MNWLFIPISNDKVRESKPFADRIYVFFFKILTAAFIANFSKNKKTKNKNKKLSNGIDELCLRLYVIPSHLIRSEFPSIPIFHQWQSAFEVFRRTLN